MNRLLTLLLITTTALLSPLLFAATLIMKSETGDKSLDGQYEVRKTNPVTWVSKDGHLTGHKLQSKKHESFLPGELVYEGVQKIDQLGKDTVIVHFLGKIDVQNKERGIYTKINPKTNAVIDHGSYEYIK